MTAIVGIDLGDRVILAADGRCSRGETIVTDQERKILQAGTWAIGVTGTSAHTLALLEAEAILAGSACALNLAWAIRKCFAAAADLLKLGEPSGENGGPRSTGCTILAAGPEGLFLLYGGGGCSKIPVDQPQGIGCGGDWAAGWLFGRLSIAKDSAGAEQLAAQAIRAVALVNMACGGEPEVVTVQKEPAP